MTFDTSPWKKYVFNLEEVLAQMARHRLVSVGIPPYPRVMPALFLPRENYILYCTKPSADMAVLKNYANIVALGETHPDAAEKVQSTAYLLKNFAFQNFLKALPKPYELLFFQTNIPMVETLNELRLPWVGHDPYSFDPVLHKEGFRKVLKELSVECIPDWIMTVPQFINYGFEGVKKRWNSSFVCQPGDYEISGSTQFVHSEEDFERVKNLFFEDPKLQKANTIRLSPFVTGEAVSMVGCVTKKGVLTGPLQLQLIDIRESLHGQAKSGAFFGHDWGVKLWPDSAEQQAAGVVEKIGKWLSARGYKGIFGVDFMYDSASQKVFPLECNPRSTGAIPAFSQVNILNGIPPTDFFTLAEFLGIEVDFDFESVNAALKKHTPASHIALLPHGVFKMNLNLPAGAYTASGGSLKYVKPAAFLHELRPGEFIIIDQVPLQGNSIVQNVPRLFKLIFPESIAENSGSIKPEYGALISGLSQVLRQNQET